MPQGMATDSGQKTLPIGMGSWSVGLAVASWVDALQAAGMRPATVELRTGTIRALYKHAGALHVDHVELVDVRAFIGRPSLAPASRRVYAASWRAWATFTGLPTIERLPRAPMGVPRPARVSGVDAAQLAAPPMVAAWIACGRWAGLRASETANLRAEDVDAVAGVLYVDGKGGQRAAVPLHPKLAAVLEPFVEDCAGRGRLWDAVPHKVSLMAGAYLREHGAADRFHQLRHYYGTAVYRQTGDLLRTQRALRHASPMTTTIYAQLGDAALAEAIASIA